MENQKVTVSVVMGISRRKRGNKKEVRPSIYFRETLVVLENGETIYFHHCKHRLVLKEDSDTKLFDREALATVKRAVEGLTPPDTLDYRTAREWFSSIEERLDTDEEGFVGVV